MKAIFAHQDVKSFVYDAPIELSAKLNRLILLVEKYDRHLFMPHSKSIGHDMFELRTSGRPQARIIYAFRDPVVLLLHGFVKKTQELPLRDFRLAKRRLNDFDKI